MALKSDLPKATALRCVKHFEGNCKVALHKIGNWEKKSQKYFLDKVFGVKGKEKGRSQAETLSHRDELDKKEKELLQKNDPYQPQFSKYVDNKCNLIWKMTLKYRRQAGLPIDINGKPIRPYTNSSEAMNHVMSQTKVEYLSAKGRQQNGNLSKLEFSCHIFEKTYWRE